MTIADIEHLHERIDKIEDRLETVVVRLNEVLRFLKFMECMQIPKKE